MAGATCIATAAEKRRRFSVDPPGRRDGLSHVPRDRVRSDGIGKRFRLYSIITIVVLLVFGGLTFLEAPHLQMNIPTPWIGLWERINISVFLLWVVMLATMLWRTGTAKGETPQFSVQGSRA